MIPIPSLPPRSPVVCSLRSLGPFSVQSLSPPKRKKNKNMQLLEPLPHWGCWLPSHDLCPPSDFLELGCSPNLTKSRMMKETYKNTHRIFQEKKRINQLHFYFCVTRMDNFTPLAVPNVGKGQGEVFSDAGLCVITEDGFSLRTSCLKQEMGGSLV